MVIKPIDDKSKRQKLLTELITSPKLSADQKKWLKKELNIFNKGIRGEAEAAHYLDSYFKDNENHVLLHDLRLAVEDDVAQIDHLIISRGGNIYLIETKNYSGNLSINDHGEFTVQYDQDAFGVPSPLEQSRRHERILRKVFANLKITGRVDTDLNFVHLVLMHPKAIIRRPAASAFDTSFLLKADQFPTWHKNFIENRNASGFMSSLINLRSSSAIKEWGELIKGQHKPKGLLDLPEFIAPKPIEQKNSEPRKPDVSSQKNPHENSAVTTAKQLICAHCGVKIDYAVRQYCWRNPARFNGLQYCREHQALF